MDGLLGVKALAFGHINGSNRDGYLTVAQTGENWVSCNGFHGPVTSSSVVLMLSVTVVMVAAHTPSTLRLLLAARAWESGKKTSPPTMK
jgi:hypothetical protein